MNQNKLTTDNESPCYHIDAAIESLRKDMHILIDFYNGARMLNKPTPPRTDADDQRLLWTLKQFRERFEKLQKKREQLNREHNCHD